MKIHSHGNFEKTIEKSTFILFYFPLNKIPKVLFNYVKNKYENI
jgi:hypothetical protein